MAKLLQGFVMLVSGVLILLGLTVSLTAAASVVWDANPTSSPFDQSDDFFAPEHGSAPSIAAVASAVVNEASATPDASVRPTSAPALATPVPSPSPTPEPARSPDRLEIPAIDLDAPIVPAKFRIIEYQGRQYPQWRAPDAFAVGWSSSSASLGRVGNTVLFGHHNVAGEVFAHLVELEVNDIVLLDSGERQFTYVIALKMILPERNQPLDVRLQNARWILPAEDERVTLLTCWPYTSNTHRLIIVAVPASAENISKYGLEPRLTPPAP